MKNWFYLLTLKTCFFFSLSNWQPPYFRSSPHLNFLIFTDSLIAMTTSRGTNPLEHKSISTYRWEGRQSLWWPCTGPPLRYPLLRRGAFANLRCCSGSNLHSCSATVYNCCCHLLRNRAQTAAPLRCFVLVGAVVIVPHSNWSSTTMS